MVRSFDGRPITPDTLDRLLANALRAPSAGNSQGTELVVLEGPEETARYWDVALPPGERRDRFTFPGLLRAPVLVVVVADAATYVARYGEADKVATGLGEGPDAWPVPYWLVDAGMAVQTLLLSAVDAGLGALFFGPFVETAVIREALGVPEGRELVGVIALGHPDPAGDRPGRSAGRPRRPAAEVVHRGRW